LSESKRKKRTSNKYITKIDNKNSKEIQRF